MGSPALDIWIERHARQAKASGAARVSVTTEDGEHVVGYHALAAASVCPRDGTERHWVCALAERGMKGQPKQRSVPAIPIGRLAVDLDHQGRQLGRSLLQDALLRCAAAADSIGARAVIVHAISAEAASYYERFGFEASPSDPHHLILLMKDLRKLLSLAN